MHATSEQTKKRLVSAFWQQYEQYPIEKISVQMVVSEAGLNRSTFYLHFQDIYQVLEIIEDELITAINQLEIPTEPTDLTVKKYAFALKHIFQNNPKVVNQLILRKRDYQFTEKFQTILQDRIIRIFQFPTIDSLSGSQKFAVESTIEMISNFFLRWATSPTTDFSDFTSLSTGLMANGAILTLNRHFNIQLPQSLINFAENSTVR